MAKFDESKVINALHKDKAEIGKKYYFSNNLIILNDNVERDDANCGGILDDVVNGVNPFRKRNSICWEFIYPYEEPPKKRMTNRQLAEWLARGNGERSSNESSGAYASNFYNKVDEGKAVPSDCVIRSWDSDEWVEPTVDIYERDCK